MTSLRLSLGTGANESKFLLTDTELLVKRAADKKWPKIQTPLKNVLWAELNKDMFEVSLLAKKKPNAPLSLLHLTGPVVDEDKDNAAAFTENILSSAYKGIQKERRLKVFVNPNSGPGKAVRLYRQNIEPIFNAARCKVDVTFTTHGKHAQGIIAKLAIDAFDAVVVMSGDGLIHEVLNGYAAHAESAKAFRLPITPIATGSGNGQAINLLGLQDSKDISVAALNAIKGRPMSTDLFCMTQSGKRYISFMTQSMGLMAEVDLGTEHLRFMGGQRFVVGFLYEVMRHKECLAKVSIKVAEKDKRKMVEVMHASRAQAEAAFASASPPFSTDTEDVAVGLPELKYTGGAHGAETNEEGWITFDKPFTYLYAGQGPFVSADFVQFPVSLPNDGLIDIVLQEKINRMTMIKAIDGAERGKPYWLNSQHYYKAHAYRVEPLSPKGFLSIDGEAYPVAPFEVEVHKGLGSFLSMYGSYQLDFPLPSDKTAKK